MVTMTINRTKQRITITRKRTQDIRLLEEVNSRANMRVKLQRTKHRLADIFRNMVVGDSVLLEGYTANCNDPDRRLRCLSMRGYSRNGELVWGMRSTEENGIKGVRVYREG